MESTSDLMGEATNSWLNGTFRGRGSSHRRLPYAKWQEKFRRDYASGVMKNTIPTMFVRINNTMYC